MSAPRIGIAVLALLLVACAGEPAGPPPGDALTDPAHGEDPTGEPTPTPTPTPEPVLTLVATVAPVADLVAQVAGVRAVVETLVPPGADAHTYEPRPRDIAVFAEADALVGIGLDLNPGAVQLAEEGLPDGAPIVLLGEGLDRGALIFDHDHDHDHDHDTDAGPNPHVWTSVLLAMELVDGVTATLVDLDPDGVEEYQDRARAYLLELRDLDEEIAEATATVPEANRKLVTYHDSWGYFGEDYGLEVVTAVQPSDFSEPSAAEVRAIIDLVRAEGVPAVFGSEVFPSDVLDAIAEETGARYVGDLADDVLPGEPGDPEHTYLGLMRRNARTIVEALGGDPSALGG